MAMEYKGLDFEIVTADHVTEVPAFNPRAEVPVLIDDDTVVCNSPDILGYLDRKFPQRLLYPVDASKYAAVREWERFADTQVDPIMTVIGNWKFADLPPMPDGLLGAARRDLLPMYDRIEAQLANREYLCGDVSAADFALYPQVGPAQRSICRSIARDTAPCTAGCDACATGRKGRPTWPRRASGGRIEQKTTDTERVNWERSGSSGCWRTAASGSSPIRCDRIRCCGPSDRKATRATIRRRRS